MALGWVGWTQKSGNWCRDLALLSESWLTTRFTDFWRKQIAPAYVGVLGRHLAFLLTEDWSSEPWPLWSRGQSGQEESSYSLYEEPTIC